jgi:hypothetical protein
MEETILQNAYFLTLRVPFPNATNKGLHRGCHATHNRILRRDIMETEQNTDATISALIPIYDN